MTLSPRARSKRPNEEAVRPFPRLEATPPVTKMCLVTCAFTEGELITYLKKGPIHTKVACFNNAPACKFAASSSSSPESILAISFTLASPVTTSTED